MILTDLEETAHALVAAGKGLLAADETPQTMTKRLDALKIESTPESRRMYREMFFTTSEIGEFISGVILQDETIRQRSTRGTALSELLARQGIIPGIKVDNGAKPLAGAPEERITEGLDGLRGRLETYRRIGARFAKWRAVIAVSDTLPNRLGGAKPWKLSFSYGRALQDEALKAWHGQHENLQAGQRAFRHRAKCDSAAALGSYTAVMEDEAAGRSSTSFTSEASLVTFRAESIIRAPSRA